MVVRFERELERDDAPGRHERGEQGLGAHVGAEAVDALPGREGEGGDEALALEGAVRQQVHVAGGEEIGFAFHAEALVEASRSGCPRR